MTTGLEQGAKLVARMKSALWPSKLRLGSRPEVADAPPPTATPSPIAAPATPDAGVAFPIVCGIELARARSPDAVVDVRSQQTYRRIAPVFANLELLAPEDRALFLADLDAVVHVPAASAAAVGPATMFGTGYVATQDGALLVESISNVSEHDVRHNLGLVLGATEAYWRGAPIAPQRMIAGPGTTLRNLGDRVWGHWLFELVPRVDLLRHHPLFAQTTFVIAHSTFRSLYEVLIASGVDPAKIIEVHDDAPMRFENYLCVTPVLRNQAWIAPQNIAFIRDIGRRAQAAAGISRGAARGRRLFITRRDAAYRKLLNLDAVTEALAAAGFEALTIGDMSFARQVALFGEIEAAVVVLGSGASNLVFAPPGTPVLYLAPNCESVLFFLDLAALAGHRLSIVFGVGRTDPLRPFADFNVALDDLRAGLASLDLPAR